MRIEVILNREGGTLKTTDLDRFSKLIEDEFNIHGHSVEILRVDGSEIVEAIDRASRRDDIDVLVVGGGDGTVSTAAASLMHGRIALGILPAGTMNLFARTLQVPLSLDGAVAALADGRIIDVDISTVNGQPFVHQFAVGIHARMVRMRDRLNFGSRIGKMLATTRAVVTTLRSLPMVDLEVDVDGRKRRIRTPALAVSNNIYGEGHLPYADNPQGGSLGVYICLASDIRSVSRLTLDILLGSWRRNPSLSLHMADRVVIDYRGRHHHQRAVLDGELCDLPSRSEVVMHPKGLKVLVPADAAFPLPAPALEGSN